MAMHGLYLGEPCGIFAVCIGMYTVVVAIGNFFLGLVYTKGAGSTHDLNYKESLYKKNVIGNMYIYKCMVVWRCCDSLFPSVSRSSDVVVSIDIIFDVVDPNNVYTYVQLEMLEVLTTWASTTAVIHNACTIQ